MSKLDEKIALYQSEMKKLGISYDDPLFRKVTKGLGPSIYKKDAETVSGSDAKELQTVKNNFLIKKLGLSDGPKLDAAMEKVVETMGKSNRNKYRAIFYYLLVKEFGKESIY
jgi:hypothetical protein